MIEVTNLVKNYGKYQAVNDITFTVNDGEILGFLGPNGAGKSTTMNILTGYISATSGEVKIGGYDILKNPQEAKKKIGYLPEIPPLYIDMTVIEYLEFAAQLKSVKKNEMTPMIKDIMEKIKISHVSHKIIKNLSKGYRQRVGLACAMIGYPEVLILDEPTVGLDPKQIIEIRDVIKELGKNHTIILSSHILSEVSAVCSRVMIINNGEIVASDTPDHLSDTFSDNKIQIRVKGEKEDILKALTSIPNIKQLDDLGSFEENTYDFSLLGNGDIRESLFTTISKSNLILLLMKSDKMSLEDIFLQVTNSSTYEKEEVLENEGDL